MAIINLEILTKDIFRKIRKVFHTSTQRRRWRKRFDSQSRNLIIHSITHQHSDTELHQIKVLASRVHQSRLRQSRVDQPNVHQSREHQSNVHQYKIHQSRVHQSNVHQSKVQQSRVHHASSWFSYNSNSQDLFFHFLRSLLRFPLNYINDIYI